MKAAIIGKPNAFYTTALQNAFARRGITAPCFPITRLTGVVGAKKGVGADGQYLEDFQILLIRAIPGGSLEQIIYRLDALHRLENLGVSVMNPPTAIERGVDKYFTLTLMEDQGLPVPRTIVTERFEDALTAFEELGGDVVVKPLFGSEGRGMVRVTDLDTAYRVFRALELGRYVYYLQEYLAHGCNDIRVFVVGDRAVASMLRRGRNWKSNIANGASAETLVLDRELAEASVRAARAVGAVYAGVDILPLEKGGYSFIEVNTIPGWIGLQKATGFDPSSYLVDYLLQMG